ncbi:MAG TPA: prepilin-type N-terminal cleavage/methylation domain-containing protein [Chthonomonadaceae bacterium]|nr:prepilin-type N-terminal cleavage/methylation domain-containing protein [Chthonomonadaceae bacterium]
MLPKLRKYRGFTLVELLVVIVILAILAAIVVPKFMDSRRRSKEAALKSTLQLLRDANERMKNDTGVYCQNLSDLAASTAPAQGYVDTGLGHGWSLGAITASDWHGPYIATVPNDPVSGTAFNWNSNWTGANNAIYSSASGNGLDGTAYNTW